MISFPDISAAASQATGTFAFQWFHGDHRTDQSSQTVHLQR
jgi:hypothetical protein